MLKQSEPVFLPFGLKACQLVGWSGRARRKDKRGHINNKQPKLLATLGLTGKQWQLLSDEIRKDAATMLNGLWRNGTATFIDIYWEGGGHWDSHKWKWKKE